MLVNVVVKHEVIKWYVLNTSVFTFLLLMKSEETGCPLFRSVYVIADNKLSAAFWRLLVPAVVNAVHYCPTLSFCSYVVWC